MKATLIGLFLFAVASVDTLLTSLRSGPITATTLPTGMEIFIGSRLGWAYATRILALFVRIVDKSVIFFCEDILRIDLGSLNAPISAILGAVRGNDDWEIGASNSAEVAINSMASVDNGDGNIADLTSGSGYRYLFFFGGDGGGIFDYNDYRLKSLTVDVPEPATLGLL